VWYFRTTTVNSYPHDTGTDHPYLVSPPHRSLRRKRFADRLREARAAAGMTQEQLGFALGLTKSIGVSVGNGRETPSFRMLPDLRRYPGRSLDELICGITPLDARQGQPTPTDR